MADSGSDSGGSAAESLGGKAPSEGPKSASGPLGTAAHNAQESAREPGQPWAGTFGTVGKPGEVQSAGFSGRLTHGSRTTSIEDQDNVFVLGASDSTEVAADSTETASDPSLGASDSTGVASDSTAVARDSTEATSHSSLDVPETTTVAPVRAPGAPVLNVVVKPVSHAVVTVLNVVGSVPATVAALPYSATPISDVITSIQVMMTTVSDGFAPLRQMRSDLYSLLGVAGTVRPALIGAGGGYYLAPSATADSGPLLGPGASQLTEVLPAGTGGMPVFGNAAPLPTRGPVTTTSSSRPLSLSGMAPLAPEGVSQPDALSFLEHAVTAILVPASLSALAALALPGVGGLLLICAAAMRVGYRQAKAGLALRTAGIARFAGPGPLGVVRSGSLIALRPRASRTVTPTASPAACAIDQAA